MSRAGSGSSNSRSSGGNSSNRSSGGHHSNNRSGSNNSSNDGNEIDLLALFDFILLLIDFLIEIIPRIISWFKNRSADKYDSMYDYIAKKSKLKVGTKEYNTIGSMVDDYLKTKISNLHFPYTKRCCDYLALELESETNPVKQDLYRYIIKYTYYKLGLVNSYKLIENEVNKDFIKIGNIDTPFIVDDWYIEHINECIDKLVI